MLFATQKLCLCPMLIFENEFSDSICQSQQSAIVTSSLRSPLGCCDRSNPWGEVVKELCIVSVFVSRWRLGRVISSRMLFATQKLCLCPMLIFENEFSDSIKSLIDSSVGAIFVSILLTNSKIYLYICITNYKHKLTNGK